MMDGFFLLQHMTLSFIRLHFPIDPERTFKFIMALISPKIANFDSLEKAVMSTQQQVNYYLSGGVACSCH